MFVEVRFYFRYIYQHCLLSGSIDHLQSLGTVEPRFNEVPRDWGKLFVISRVRYIENLDITNLWENN